MSQPVKLSDSLVLDARMAANVLERSIAGQIEFWARLGRSIEPLLHGDQVLARCKADHAVPISECLKAVGSTEGRRRTLEYLRSQPYPHYEAAPEELGLLVRIDQDGTRTLGRFVNRQFQPVKPAKK